ncbi:MAG: hypothetical protein ACE3JQ_09880 [Paenisporosarcina sp.]
MKKFLIGMFVFFVVLAGIGFGLYYYGTNVASDKVVDSMTKDLEDSGKMNEVRALIESDPELSEMMEEAKAADPDTLPFKTKGEATRVLINKIGVNKLQEIQGKVQSGTASKEEILQDLKENLTEEEMLALQVLAYEEIYNQK